MEQNNESFSSGLAQMSKQIQQLEEDVKKINQKLNKKKLTILLMSGDLDKALVAFTVAAGALTMQYEAVIYCTFWGVNLLKRNVIFKDADIYQKMAKIMMEKGSEQATLSKMHMFGLGTQFFKILMKKSHVVTLPDLIETTKSLGLKLYACEMTMGIMCISREEMMDSLEYGSVQTYLKQATDSSMNLVI